MNKSLVYQYSKLVKFLGAVLGPDYEIALHDISGGRHHIVAIANGHVSGRSVGAPLSDASMRMMLEHAYETEDYRLHYKGLSGNNKTLRSSTMFIKDDSGDLVGMLCINFDGGRYSELSNKILELCQPWELPDEAYEMLPLQPDESPVIENLFQTISDATKLAVESVLGGEEVEPGAMSRREKMQVVDTLNKKGVFLLKGAVGQVARLLGSSEATIYRYLSKIHQQEEQEEPNPKEENT